MSANNKPEFWIITGAASGIGAAVVRAARESGASVLAVDVDEAKVSALAEETGAMYRLCDVGDLSTVAAISRLPRSCTRRSRGANAHPPERGHSNSTTKRTVI